MQLKKLLKSYTTFTRTERIGILCLCALLIILISIRATMYLWVHPSFDTEQEKKLVAAWETFKRTQTTKPATDTSETSKHYKDQGDENAVPLPGVINLNTTDSATLVRLRGIGPVTAGRIVARIRNKGPFTSIDQLREVGAFSNATFDTLKKHLTVNAAKHDN